MIFDTWGGALATPDYLEFSLAYMEQILAGLVREREGRRVPVILFTKGGGIWLARMAATGADALGIDSTTELSAARQATGDRVALQGNLDPAAAARAAGAHPRRRRAGARKLRARARPCVQPGSRRPAGHQPGTCRGDDRGRARALAAVPQLKRQSGHAARCFLSSSRSVRRRILPTLVFGSSSRK